MKEEQGIRAGGTFTIRERHAIIRELLTTGVSRSYIWKKYTGKSDEHGHLLRWMLMLGYGKTISEAREVILQSGQGIMMAHKHQPKEDPGDEDFDVKMLKKRVLELEKQLKEAELKAIAFSTMVDVAEEMFKVPIRKKLNTKP